MTPAERVARLKQLYDQVKALNDEIAQLEAEDDPFVAFKQRSEQAGRRVLSYPDFVRYSAFRDQLETAWAAAGRPRAWDRAELLLKLRDVLLVGGPDLTAGAPAPPPSRVVARPAPAQPTPPSPPRSAGSVGGRRLGGRPPAAAGPVTASQLIEMHSPILKEVGDLTGRAEEEFRTGQTTSALVSVERAAYLLERVAHAPPVMSERLIKVLDEGLKEGVLADADRARREQVRGRIATVLEAES